MLFRGILLLFCAVLCLGKQIGLEEYISHRFKTNSDYPLLHIALNNRDGNIYLSCVNRLYQLNKNLDSSSLIEVVTGPVNDSEICLPYGRECDASSLSLTNNYNKLLVADINRNRLLVCGSIYQGLCEARSLSNISAVVSGNPGLDCLINDCPLVSCLTEECTTITVIAEGPTVYNPVLYVATTVVETVFRNDFKNSISTRSLHVDPTKENKLFLWTIDGKSRSKKSYAKLADEGDFDKYFKYGFSTDGLDGFVYFVFQKTEKATGAMSTVIARVCKKDPFLYSYIEMTLTCEGVQQQYNGELVGAYFQKNVGKTDFNLRHSSQGALYVVYRNGASSSLCIYTIEDLNNIFDDTIVSCYRYNGRNAADTTDIAESHAAGGGPSCGTKFLPVGSDLTLDSSALGIDKAPTLSYYPGYELEEGKLRCGASYLPKAVERIPAVESTWSYRHMGVNFSGVTVDLVQGINVAYIGTEGGKIIELDVNHKNNFNTINIGKPVLSELLLDKDASLPVPNLYAMTSSEVFHMKVSVCERHATCSECLEAKDPYCGWCILKSSCLPLSSECSSGWLEPLSQQCIEASTPEPLERTLQQSVVTKVKLLPSLSAGNVYQCMFDGKVMTQATVDASDNEVISCPAPRSDQLPQNLDGEDYVNVTLSILYNGAKTIVTTSATFYECQAHGRSLDQLQPCDSCLNNRWSDKCSWCVESHECLPRSTRSCMTTSNSCPKVTSAVAGSQLLPVGVPTDIVVNVEGLPQSATDMKCKVEIGQGNIFETNAAIVDEARTQIRCDRQTYKYSVEKKEVPASVTVYWESNYNLDAEIDNPVSFYNCSIGYDDCSLCVTSLPKYNCGWCGDKCVVEQMCDKNWIKDPGQCPGPEIKYIVIAIALALLVIGVVCVFWYKKRRYKSNKNEISVRAFAEPGIDTTDLTADIGDVGLPILSYRQYATNMFFPNARFHVCMKEPNANDKPTDAIQRGFDLFHKLINNKQFLMSFIRTLEEQRGFSNRDKLNVASLITVVLHKKLDYFTEVMKGLIKELVVTSELQSYGDPNLKLTFCKKHAFTTTETVAERMFSNWLSICLFPYIRDTAGKPVFRLHEAIKHKVSKGALDAVVGKTRYTLSDDCLLKEDIPCEALTLSVSQSETDEPVFVKVLSCDSISQVKEKIMDAVYKRIPIPQRLEADQLDLEWRCGRSGHIILPDIEYANEPGSRWRRVLTIRDYKVENNATMALVEKLQNADDVVSQLTNQSADVSATSPMLPDDNVKRYHMVKCTDDLEQKRERAMLRDKHKHITKIYLPRLEKIKRILQSYVDEVFSAILQTSSIPPAVKHFFDFLDELAKKNEIEDPEILHTWKTNSVLDRFWVTILKSPEAVFDIDKPESVESFMAVISQTFIDACSVQEHKPTKDSPINQQLYAKEIPKYKRMVQKYYQHVQSMQSVSNPDMSAHMTEISRSHNLEFDVHAAHNELWGYVNKYYEELHENVTNDPNSRQMEIQRLQQAHDLIDGSINNP